ncbi:MAG TPA: 2,3-bisphosphoglycerate-independent phosphoglycerate mutase [Armatimonadota bacterium]
MASAETDGRKATPMVLIIRDGWGVNPDPRDMVNADGNAVLMAKTPVQDRMLAECPHSLLTTSGMAVGLPEGQMGNSEVGHLNIGAGRVVYQELTRISKAIVDGDFFEAQALVGAVERVKQDGGTLHLIGLCSDGGVHSHLDHLYALLRLARDRGLSRVAIHCLMDGRDTSPTSGVEYLQQIQDAIAEIGVGHIATVIGRYFAMDRDKRWDRVAKAYEALTLGAGRVLPDPVAAMRTWYGEGTTDEFVPPTVIAAGDAALPENTIRDGDAVIFFNFRADRAREITTALAFEDFKGFERAIVPKIEFVCLTEYDEKFGLPVAFPSSQLSNTLSDVLAAHGLKQLRIAETEKYPHVTYFFNGGDEVPSPGEDRYLVPSPKVATYDMKPSMSANEVTEELLKRLKAGMYDVVILNYANADMVGHTGVLEAAIEAVETVDKCVGQVLETVLEQGGCVFVTADHGNAERLLDVDGKPFTSHTTYPVNLFYVARDAAEWTLRDGILSDIAPTMLSRLGLPIPPEMTGKPLLCRKS